MAYFEIAVRMYGLLYSTITGNKIRAKLLREYTG